MWCAKSRRCCFLYSVRSTYGTCGATNFSPTTTCFSAAKSNTSSFTSTAYLFCSGDAGSSNRCPSEFFKKDTQHANVKNYGVLVGMAGGVLGVVASFVPLFFVVQEKSNSLSSLFGSSSDKTTSIAVDTVTPFFLNGQGQTDVTSHLSAHSSVVSGFWVFLAVLFFVLCIASALYLFHKFQQPVSRVCKVSKIANAVLFGTFCLGFVLTLVFWVYSNNYLSVASYSALGITVTAGPAVLLYLFSTIALFVPLVWKPKSN